MYPPDDDFVLPASTPPFLPPVNISYAALIRAKFLLASSRSFSVESGPTITSGWYCIARFRYARLISFASVVGSNPSRRNGSSVWGSGGGFVLLDEEEDDAYNTVLDINGAGGAACLGGLIQDCGNALSANGVQ